MNVDLTVPLSLGAIIQAVTPLIAALAFLFALRQMWRSMMDQRTHDREFMDHRMANIERMLEAANEELKLMRETLLTVANQGVRLDFLEKTLDDLKRGVGFIAKPT